MYFRLPLSSAHTAASHSRPSSAQGRYPLISPTVTLPSVCANNSCATRRDSNSGDAIKARALLSRVASSPVAPRVGGAQSGASSPSSSHSPTSHDEEGSRVHPGVVGAMERRYSDGYEAARGWTGHQQRDGYISFPDYEKYFDYETGNVASSDHQRREIQA